MAEYIEREVAKKEFNLNFGSVSHAIIANRILDAIPAADVVPVVHGRWTLNKDGSGTCNRCHFTQKNAWDMDNWQNFCGVCGARMDEEG